MKAAIVVHLVLAGVAGLTPAGRKAATAGAAESRVRAVLDRQVEAWNRGDLDGFMAGYWNSPDLVFQSGGTITRGWPQTLERYRRRYRAEGKEMGRLRFEDLDVQPLSPDAAFVRGRWQLTMKDGTQPGGLFTLLLRRFGGEWKIVHDHTSESPPK